MREIKFRAWDKRGKKMYQCRGLWLIPQIMAYPNDEDRNPLAEFELMQYTGLTDKNGREIYEGDIVENINRDYRQVLYKTNGFEMRLMNGKKEHDGTIWYNTVKVIGNIHENPELLNE